MKDKILSTLRANGPMLPIEIGSRLNIDSFLANAFLSELQSSGEIKTSPEKIGNAFLFYVPGQEEAVKSRIEQIKNQKQTLQQYGKQFHVSPELKKKREKFAERFKPLIDESEKEPAPAPYHTIEKSKPFSPKIEIIKESPQEKKEEKTTFPAITKKILQKISPFKEPKENLYKKTIEILKQKNIEILYQNSQAKELKINIPTPLGSFKYLIVIKNKKRINEGDLSLIYSKSIETKMPIILVTNGKISKPAEQFMKSIEGIIKIIQI